MIRFQPITTADTSSYGFLENLLVSAFPPEEYRDLAEQRKNTDEVPAFHTLIIRYQEEKGEEEIMAGLLTYWQFGTFRYIEHFAVRPDLRSKGIGHQALTHFCLHSPDPVVLEAEPPEEPMACRRIGFYERHGFRSCPFPYRQPPYRSGGSYFPLILMAYGEVEWEKRFTDIRDEIYRNVYRV